MLGLQIYTVRQLITDEESAEKTIRAIRDTGYECIQLAGGIDAVKLHADAAKKCGMKVIGVLTNMQTCLESGDELIKTALDSSMLDIGISGTAKTEAEARELANAANEFAKKVRAAGLSFSYHNHSHEYIRTECKKTVMQILLELFDPKFVDLMPDTYWLQHGGVDVRDFTEKHGTRVKILHLKDMKRTPDGVTFAEVGEGNLNMAGIIKTAKAQGIDCFIVEQDICDGDPMDSVKISYANTKKLLETQL